VTVCSAGATEKCASAFAAGCRTRLGLRIASVELRGSRRSTRPRLLPMEPAAPVKKVLKIARLLVGVSQPLRSVARRQAIHAAARSDALGRRESTLADRRKALPFFLLQRIVSGNAHRFLWGCIRFARACRRFHGQNRSGCIRNIVRRYNPDGRPCTS
jgi:hypothetical protein